MTTPLTAMNQGINKGVLNPEVVEILEKVKKIVDVAVNLGLFIPPGGRRSYFQFVKSRDKTIKGYDGQLMCNRFILDSHINDDEYLKLHEADLLQWSYNKDGKRGKGAYFRNFNDEDNAYTQIMRSHTFLRG